jgi:hypothetical protein
MREENMNWINRNKKCLMMAAVPALVGAWWLFRPEKLWVTERVNEAAPFMSMGDPTPIYTGKFEGRAEATKGRATVYKTADGKLELRLTDLQTAAGDGLSVMLAKPSDRGSQQMAEREKLNGEEVGILQSGSMEQRYMLPTVTDLSLFSTVVIYSKQANNVVGVAKLEAF